MLKLQAQALVKDIAQSGDVVPPDRIASSISALVRVANNSIAAQNNSQGRESRQRMSTTFVMAIQVPQILNIPGGKGDAHEIYLAHIGDSRAYWITRDRCQLLTIDDDIATREVKQGRDLYSHSHHRPDATCLTQALGTKSGEAIVPSIRRLMALEDGVLVLCSDGLSDRHLIERSWAEFVPPILDGNLPLADAVSGWIDRANRESGDDNISVVLMHCQVSGIAGNGGGSYLATTNTTAIRNNRSPFSIEFATGKAFRAVTLTLVMLGVCAAALLGTAILRPEWIGNWQEKVMPEK
jgi:protein phosphatase